MPDMTSHYSVEYTDSETPEAENAEWFVWDETRDLQRALHKAEELDGHTGVRVRQFQVEYKRTVRSTFSTARPMVTMPVLKDYYCLEHPVRTAKGSGLTPVCPDCNKPMVSRTMKRFIQS